VQLRLSSTPAAEAPAAPDGRRRDLAAVLRWRLRLLDGAVAPRLARAARLVPVLLHASFEGPRLRDEAPGVAGLRYRRSWTVLSREFELPAPFKAQRGAPSVEAVLALPGPGALTALVLLAPGRSKSERAWVAERAAVASAILGERGAALDLVVIDPPALARDPALVARLVVHGCLLGGRLSGATWEALEAAAKRPLEPRTLVAMARHAGTPLASLALTLLSTRPAPAPLPALRRLLADGAPAKRLADPDALCTGWAAGRTDLRADALAALAAVRAAAADPARSAPPPEAAELLALGGRLSLSAARAIREARKHGLDQEALATWSEAIGPSFPRALLPALGRALGAAGPLRTVLARRGDAHEVRLPGGAVLGCGATPVQARVRALSMLASAALDAVVANAEPPWRALAGRLAPRRERPTLLLVVEPAVPSGPPYDPLNRGPERLLGFPGALEVRLTPGRRPAARVLTGDEAVERLVAQALAGEAVEVVPSRAEAHPVAARLGQVAALLRERRAGVPVALEAGGRVLLPGPAGLRRFPLHRFLARPRAFVPDPDAPDLALAPGERRPAGLSGAGLVECRAALLDDQRASVLYQDAAHGWFREEVFLVELEEHLREVRAVLSQAAPDAVLAVRLSDGVEPALRRVGRAGAAVPVAVRGQLPFDLQVEVGGERYGGTSGHLGWRAAALAVLSRWPRRGEGRLAVNAVTVQARGRRGVGLVALYARSVALRRLRRLMVRELQALTAGQFEPMV